jgi:hypothetical protein
MVGWLTTMPLMAASNHPATTEHFPLVGTACVQQMNWSSFVSLAQTDGGSS